MKTGKVQRQEHMLYEKLKETGKLTLDAGKELLGVSESTVRRFFSNLETTGRAIRTHGGIQLMPGPAGEAYSFELSNSRQIEQKQRIAAFAVSLLEYNDIIYIDSGTTLFHFTTLLAERLEAEEDLHVVVVSNSLSNLNILQKHERLMLIGGEFREHRRDFSGYLAEEMLKYLRFSKCFLGSDGYIPGFGFTTTDFNTARLNEIVLENSEQSYVLMDTSKFYTSAPISYSRNHTVHTLITDKQPPQDAMEDFICRKTDVKICSKADNAEKTKTQK